MILRRISSVEALVETVRFGPQQSFDLPEGLDPFGPAYIQKNRIPEQQE